MLKLLEGALVVVPQPSAVLALEGAKLLDPSLECGTIGLAGKLKVHDLGLGIGDQDLSLDPSLDFRR